MKFLQVLSRYPTYIVVGSCITLVTIIIRNLIGLLIEDETNSKYISSIIIAYFIGTVLSVVAHKSVTFRVKNGLSIVQVFKFVAIHLLGMTITLIGSGILRARLLDAWLPVELSKMLAFAFLAFIVSLITYLLKKLVVFDDS